MRKVVLIVLTLLILSSCSNINNSDEFETKSSDIIEKVETVDKTDKSSNENDVEFVESSDNIAKSVKAEAFLRQEVMELEELEKYIFQKSNEKAFMIIESDVTLHKVNFEGSDDEYFLIYVGEQYDDHEVNWFWFYVSLELDKVLNYDIVEGEVLSLSDWRESSSYTEKFGFMNE